MKKKWKGKKVVETKSEFREDVEVTKKIVDSTGSSEIVFNTINKLTITFFSNGSASAIDGKAYLN